MDNNEQKNLFWRSDGSSFRTLNETCSRDGKKIKGLVSLVCTIVHKGLIDTISLFYIY